MQMHKEVQMLRLMVQTKYEVFRVQYIILLHRQE